jgi:hypothetical protein
MTTHLPLRRCGAATLVLALAAGAGAPLAATLPVLLAPAPKVEVRRLHLDCPGLKARAPAARPGPWLARCGLIRG